MNQLRMAMENASKFNICPMSCESASCDKFLHSGIVESAMTQRFLGFACEGDETVSAHSAGSISGWQMVGGCREK